MPATISPSVHPAGTFFPITRTFPNGMKTASIILGLMLLLAAAGTVDAPPVAWNPSWNMRLILGAAGVTVLLFVAEMSNFGEFCKCSFSAARRWRPKN